MGIINTNTQRNETVLFTECWIGKLTKFDIEDEQSGENQTNYFYVVDESRSQQIEMRTLKHWCFCYNI